MSASSHELFLNTLRKTKKTGPTSKRKAVIPKPKPKKKTKKIPVKKVVKKKAKAKPPAPKPKEYKKQALPQKLPLSDSGRALASKAVSVSNCKLLKKMSRLEDKCVGCLLSSMIGDILGAGVEGYDTADIRVRFKSTRGEVRDFTSDRHMGIYYFGERYGMYTDDTMCTLGLATTLIEEKTVDPQACAYTYGKFYYHKPMRGCPNTARHLLEKLFRCKGSEYKTIGTMNFPDGSFSNGGAMRISPIGLAFREAKDKDLHEATRLALLATHIHPEAVDGAFCIAKAVALCMNTTPIWFDEVKFVTAIRDGAKTKIFKNRLSRLLEEVKKLDDTLDRISVDNWEKLDHPVIVKIIGTVDFQLKAIEMIPCVLWCVCRYWKEPENCLIKAVGFGGDTDTRAIIGALHGTSWIPTRWFHPIESGPHGRDYCIKTAKSLAKLNLHTVVAKHS